MPKGSSRTPSVERSAVYRKAAQILENDKDFIEFSCHAIYLAKHNRLPKVFLSEDYPEVVAYGDLFRPDDATDFPVLWFSGMHDREEAENHRIVMLCMMAAMVEAGDA